MNRWLLGILVMISLGGVAYTGYWAMHNGREGPSFRTMSVEVGRFEAAVSATGTLVPEETVDVGAQVSGQLVRMGLDPRYETTLVHDILSRSFPAAPMIGCMIPTKSINYSSPVEKGTVLAQLDTSLFQIDVDDKQSNLSRSAAEQLLAETKLEKAEDDWNRAQSLFNSKAISTEEYKLAKVNFKLAQGEIERCRHLVGQAKSALSQAEKNLEYATIRAPAKGVVIERRVNVGQTVQSSFNAPSLFLLGTDLRQLQIWASVNEADIFQIQERQKVAFTVEASGELFFGFVAVDQPRLNASMTMNVVTYTVVVDIDNSKGKLRPYQTANVRFLLTQKEKALLVPNAALRWRPTRGQVAEDAVKTFDQITKQRRATVLERLQEKENPERFAWVAVNGSGKVRPVKVLAGLTDGTMTEVLGGDLTEGTEVVVGEEIRDDARSNPFTSSRSKKD